MTASDYTSVHVYGYANGGPQSFETYRIAWCAAVGFRAEDLDFRDCATRGLVKAGLAGVTYARGAHERDLAVSYAHRRALEASRRELAELARLG